MWSLAAAARPGRRHDGAAHHGITIVDRCACGHERLVEKNNGRRTDGPWEMTEAWEDPEEEAPGLCCGDRVDAPGFCTDGTPRRLEMEVERISSRDEPSETLSVGRLVATERPA